MTYDKKKAITSSKGERIAAVDEDGLKYPVVRITDGTEEASINTSNQLEVTTTPKSAFDTTVVTATGSQSVDWTSTPVTGLDNYSVAVIRLDIVQTTTPDADDEIDYYIQTSYNGGTDWADVENIHYANADNGTQEVKLVVISNPQSSAVARDETDGTLADDTKLDLPLGDRIRIKVKVTGATAPTWNFSAQASFRQ